MERRQLRRHPENNHRRRAAAQKLSQPHARDGRRTTQRRSSEGSRRLRVQHRPPGAGEIAAVEVALCFPPLRAGPTAAPARAARQNNYANAPARRPGGFSVGSHGKRLERFCGKPRHWMRMRNSSANPSTWLMATMRMPSPANNFSTNTCRGFSASGAVSVMAVISASLSRA